MNDTTRARLDGALSLCLQPALALVAAVTLVAGCGKNAEGTASKNDPNPSSSTRQASSKAADGAPAKPNAPFVMPADAGPAGPADLAWVDFEKAFSTPPQPPDSWETNRPSPAEIKTFQQSQGAAAEKIAAVAKDFYTQFPTDPRAVEARGHEMELLDAAVKLGRTNALARLESLEKVRLDDATTPEEERFAIRMSAAQRKAQALAATDEAAARKSFEESAQALIKEFPQRPEPYQMLLSLASDAPTDKARATALSLTSTNVPETVREAATALLKKLDQVGKPIDLKFTALDGREVDVAKLHGKVVLVDFWATWCGPCMRELPNVKATYAKLHDKGFEIVGISLDQKKEALTDLIAKEQIPWPQYFDGKGWENQHAQRFGIESIPAMWLLDKQGNVRDLDAHDGLESKITKLLDEPAPAAAAKP